MTPREIIAQAWAITRREKVLRRWGLTYSFLETLLAVKLFSYQVYFLWEYIAGRSSGFWDIEIILYRAIPFWLFLTFIITILTMFIVEFFIPHMAQGAIIGLAAKSYRREELKGGFLIAFYNFFPIFAIHEIFALASTTMMITVISLVLRYIPGDMKLPLIIGIVVMWIISNIIKFFCSFAEAAVVLRRVSIFSALGQSFQLIISYTGHVLFLVLLLFVISIRIVFNLITIFLIPAIIMGLTMFLTLFLSQTLSISIALIIGLGLIIFASYLLAHLHIFKTTVWTLAYIDLSEKKNLHVIME